MSDWKTCPKSYDHKSATITMSKKVLTTYRAKGYFYGSGVIEAGCKAVIGKRAKQSGMFWSEKGAEDVLAIRTALYSDRFDQFWDDRNAA